MLLDANVPAFSFIFGIPAREILEECRAKGIVTIGAATTPDEAASLQEAGVNAIAASGFEAGGGIAAHFFTQVMSDAKALGATGLQARVRDDKLEALEFVSRRGFRESHRMVAYRLNFTQADMAGCQAAFARLRDRDVEVTTLAAVREHDPDHLQKFFELYSAAREDWPDPDPDPTGPSPVDLDWLKRWLEDARLPDAFFIAKHAQHYVAFTSFFGIGTAVHPKYRHQGIATLLKAGSIADGQRRGFQGQTTSTASPAMQKVLEKLRYERSWSEIRLIRAME